MANESKRRCGRKSTVNKEKLLSGAKQALLE